MLRFLARRIGLLVITLWFMSLVIYAVTAALPGDVATMILGQSATAQDLATIRHQMHLDRPIYARYLTWLGGALRGNLGYSLRTAGWNPATQKNTGVTVASLLVARTKNSLALAAMALLIGIPLSVGLGVISAVKRDTWIDRAIGILTVFAFSLPEFVTGAFLIVVFTSWLKLLPPLSIIAPDSDPLRSLSHLILPALTLMFVMLAHAAQLTRASMVQELDSPYVRTAWLKGLPRREVIYKHALRNALIPTVTLMGMNFGYLMGGLIVVETVFGYPGLGQLMTFAVAGRDVPLLQGVTLEIVVVYLVANLIADIVSMYLDPKVRYA